MFVQERNNKSIQPSSRITRRKLSASVGDGELVEFSVVVGEKGNEAANVTGPNGEPVRGSPYAADRRRGYRQWYYPRGGRRPSNRRPPRDSQSEGEGKEGLAPGGDAGGPQGPPRRYRPRRGGRGGYAGGGYYRGPYRGPPGDQENGDAPRGRGPPRRFSAETSVAVEAEEDHDLKTARARLESRSVRTGPVDHHAHATAGVVHLVHVAETPNQNLETHSRLLLRSGINNNYLIFANDPENPAPIKTEVMVQCIGDWARESASAEYNHRKQCLSVIALKSITSIIVIC
ncbi:hypothetical protein NQ318_009621 [Aromia moschata]|uniref:Uncharacterized protein n=1 Tax=Aromia moschata TaxID=1265417 RepID=A0AAV8Y977_9CUCU|nr:hypothetical protein NQ318_009621 [Aromia moschata]